MKGRDSSSRVVIRRVGTRFGRRFSDLLDESEDWLSELSRFWENPKSGLGALFKQVILILSTSFVASIVQSLSHETLVLSLSVWAIIEGFRVFFKSRRRRRRRRLKVQGEGCRSRKFVSSSSFSGNQVPFLPCGFIDLLIGHCYEVLVQNC